LRSYRSEVEIRELVLASTVNAAALFYVTLATCRMEDRVERALRDLQGELGYDALLDLSKGDLVMRCLADDLGNEWHEVRDVVAICVVVDLGMARLTNADS